MLDTGEFWKPVRKVKNKPASKAAPTYVVARLGAVTVTSDMPLIPYRYPTFKDKVKTEGSPLSGKIAYTYSKPDGETTQRTVLLKSAYPTGQAQYLVGHCELRNEERTFAVDRMSAAVDLSTGREIPDVQQWLVCAAK